jgi:hypothetical protein
MRSLIVLRLNADGRLDRDRDYFALSYVNFNN